MLKGAKSQLGEMTSSFSFSLINLVLVPFPRPLVLYASGNPGSAAAGLVQGKKEGFGYLRPLPRSQSWSVKSASSRQLWEGGSHLLKLDSFKAVNCQLCYLYGAEGILAPCVITHLCSAVVSPIHLNSSAVLAL